MKETISKQRHTSMMFLLPQEFLISFVVFANMAMTKTKVALQHRLVVTQDQV